MASLNKFTLRKITCRWEIFLLHNSFFYLCVRVWGVCVCVCVCTLAVRPSHFFSPRVATHPLFLSGKGKVVFQTKQSWLSHCRGDLEKENISKVLVHLGSPLRTGSLLPPCPHPCVIARAYRQLKCCPLLLVTPPLVKSSQAWMQHIAARRSRAII